MLKGTVSLLEVRKVGVQGPLGKLGMVNALSQSKQIVGSGSARSETSHCRAVVAMILRPMHQMLIEDDGVEPRPVQGLPAADCNGLGMCRVQGASPLVNGRHQPRADACWSTAVQAAGI